MRRCMGCMREFSEEFDICPYCGYVYDTPAKSSNHLSPGTVLQTRYMLGKVLGQGGFGITYIAWDQRLEKPVAIKEFFPTAFASRSTGCYDISCFNAESQQYFNVGLKKMMDESRALARFTHLKNVVQVLDCIEENGTAYIIMELLRGETVQAMLNREKKLSLAQTMQIMMPIIQALEEIHQTGLVHRDISPDNIFVCEDGTAKLLDFGAARIAGGMDHKTLSVMLKKGFAPIEQYSSHGKQGAFTDVYAVCATMYKMLTGETPENSLDRMALDTLQPISDYAEIPERIEEIILRGMAVESDDRIQSAGELYALLQGAARDAETYRAGQTEQNQMSNRVQEKPRRSKTTSRKIIGIAAAALAVCLVTLGIVFVLRTHRSTPVSEPVSTLSSSVEIGDTVQFGAYGIEGEPAQPIDWIVLDRSGDQVLLLSKKGLDNQVYHGDSGICFTWQTSEIREWLNTTFYDAAFSDAEKETVCLHENANPANPVFGTPGGENTFDRCFLLSIKEVEKYFPTTAQRRAECTNALYERDFSDTDGTNHYIWWALRSPGGDYWPAESNMTFTTVSPEGVFCFDNDGLQDGVVRPAVWVDVSGGNPQNDVEWVSEHRTHLYAFSLHVQDGVLTVSGNGMMPVLTETDWQDFSKEDITGIVIEQGVTSISDDAFSDLPNLTSVQIPDSVTEIGGYAFEHCKKLKEIKLPSSLRRLGRSAFHDTGIAENQNYWKNGMLCIDHCLVRVSQKVTGKVVVPKGITVIGMYAAAGCIITEAQIPEGVKRLESTFFECKNLRSVELPDGIQWISGAFDYCESLEAIRLPKHLQILESGFYACESLTEIDLPKELTYIGDQAFCCCWNLENVSMHNRIKYVESCAFFNCPSIESALFYGTKAEWDTIQFSDGNETLRENVQFDPQAEDTMTLSDLSVGKTVSFGRYEQDGNLSNGAEEIEWLVIDEDGDNRLLLSRKALVCQPYHVTYTDVTWETCSLRTWLNDAFFAQAFTSAQRESVVLATQKNTDNKKYNVSGGADTKDSVFLLSAEEVDMLADEDRTVQPTAYAVEQGAYQNVETGNSWWLLRSPGAKNDLCAIVRSDGTMPSGGEKVNAAGAIRPAIWISLSSD